MRYLSIAWNFLSIIPIPGGNNKLSSKEFAASMSCFPIVGLLFGIILATVWQQLIFIFSIQVSNILILFLPIIFSGGIHVDGLADATDGMYGGETKERVLAIMRDEQVGAMALIAVLFNFLIKVAAINSIPIEYMPAAIIVMPAIGRCSMVAVAYFSKYARDNENGLGKPFTDHVGFKTFMFALAVSLAATFYFLKIKGIVPLLTVTATTAIIIFYFKKKIGGITGDVLGTSNEITETVFLLMLSFHLPVVM